MAVHVNRVHRQSDKTFLFDISICGNIKMIGVSSEIESRKINWDKHVTQA